ncbi:hypothetical protein K458DRAFT_303696 [Lentithecium fluviatile CBS 122367]|uniref:Alpha/beta-hydrolase n=1 Tax=Lentithecium fluviatile CBS 122367 TaxID=1168545 RepID=A0A6G1J136_9PLEO|nr:hypothetical protein K458DRAFT_303696 [Lentithecium fluviatile CBS 122367]
MVHIRLILALLATLPTFSLALLQTFQAHPRNYLAKGDGDFAGSIVSISLSDLTYPNTSVASPTAATGSDTETPKAPGTKTSSSGPYPAYMTTDTSLTGHTVFAPKSLPSGDLSLPFVAWGNGGCGLNTGQYEDYLVEVASWGYAVAAGGTPEGAGESARSQVQDMRSSVDWAMAGKAGKAAKYGNVDATKITTAGHSCGGLEAMSRVYHDERYKLRGGFMMFNIAISQDDRRYLLSEIKVPVAYFIGGKPDMGYLNSAKDYALLNAGLPKLRANLDTGHGCTYQATNGGEFCKAAVAYLEWQWRANETVKAVFFKIRSRRGSLVKDN